MSQNPNCASTMFAQQQANQIIHHHPTSMKIPPHGVLYRPPLPVNLFDPRTVCPPDARNHQAAGNSSMISEWYCNLDECWWKNVRPFANSTELFEHICGTDHLNFMPFKCATCSLGFASPVFASLNSLEDHARTTHANFEHQVLK